jgi:LCP family protein required for cell wall assembly
MNRTENENEVIKEPAEPDYVAPISDAEKADPVKGEAEHFDYVIPAQSFKDHLKNPAASRTHSGQTKMASKEEMDKASEGYVFLTPYREKVHHHHHHHSGSSAESKGLEGADLVDPTKLPPRKHRSHSGDEKKRHHRRRKPLWLRILIIAGIVLLAAAVALAGTYLVMREIGRRNLHDYDDIVIVTPTEEKGEEIMNVVDSGRTIVYEDDSYHFNENIVSIVVIGVDHDIENNAVQSMGDSVNIVALDTETGRISVVAVSRDTMTDVNLYSDEGAYIDTERLQLAYAYSFGNNHVSGGENTLAALSKLFFGLPLDNYFAINMEALVTLNDAIGGVTLTSSIDFTSRIDGSYISAGDTVTLYGKDADYYVRNRDTEKLDSNNGRMQRQQEYIRAFFRQVMQMIKKDTSVVTRLYDIVQANSDTTLDLPKVTYLASVAAQKMNGEPEIEYLSISGEITRGEYAEFNPDDRSILETMLKVFYTKDEASQ